jgi:NAD(P)-dependent dehydrogenase (short-subunit alcohol dehydrogenase family)
MYSGEKVLAGFEHGKAADYAMRLNLAAQINLVDGALPRLSVGGRIVFVTSHLAHFYGSESSSPLAFHADVPIYIQCPRLGFQQSS